MATKFALVSSFGLPCVDLDAAVQGCPCLGFFWAGSGSLTSETKRGSAETRRVMPGLSMFQTLQCGDKFVATCFGFCCSSRSDGCGRFLDLDFGKGHGCFDSLACGQTSYGPKQL